MCDTTELCLLIDMGNTRIKWVWVRGGMIIESSLGRGRPADFFELCSGPDGIMPGRILLSSVASQSSTAEMAVICARKFGMAAQVVQASSNLAGIENGYENPAALGVDRWLAIVGAAHSYGVPLIVMDLGTATTLDAVDQLGRHLGGLILPGPALMLNALAGGTVMRVPTDLGQEPDFDRSLTPAGVGPATSTAAAITGGIYAAQIGALAEFRRNVSARLGAEPKVVLTGGAAEGIMRRMESVAVFDPWLVFKGMLQVE